MFFWVLLSKHLDMAGCCKSAGAINLILHIPPASADLCSTPRYHFTPLQGLAKPEPGHAELGAGTPGLPGAVRPLDIKVLPPNSRFKSEGTAQRQHKLSLPRLQSYFWTRKEG